jgi:uncharacterized protein
MKRSEIICKLMKFEQFREILENKEFLKTKLYIHHGAQTRFDHCIDVANRTFEIAKKRGYDYFSATRGALLHDFFFYNWLTEGPRLHGFRHSKIAYQNASKIFLLNEIEKDSILRHMWPLTPTPPRFKESMVVCYADKTVTIKDYKDKFIIKKNKMIQVKHARRKKNNY